ncbi:MAG: hypothetical protein ACPGUC_08435 [Gammaproteobacteria bacterium]
MSRRGRFWLGTVLVLLLASSLTTMVPVSAQSDATTPEAEEGFKPSETVTADSAVAFPTDI